MVESDATKNDASFPLNLTDDVPVKPEPVIVTVVFQVPPSGLKPVITGTLTPWVRAKDEIDGAAARATPGSSQRAMQLSANSVRG